ncbi:MAG: Lrp/AsnC family transcriptional regulator [Candidatus Micrarchaeia archaeon]
MANNLDEKDTAIIHELRRSCRLSARKLAKKLGMHPATLLQRMRRLEGEGVIKGYVADIDYLKMGYEFMAMVEISIRGDILKVQEQIKNMAGVVAVYDVTGETDSVVIAMCKSRAELSRLIKSIRKLAGVEKTNTHVILNVVKDMGEFIP